MVKPLGRQNGARCRWERPSRRGWLLTTMITSDVIGSWQATSLVDALRSPGPSSQGYAAIPLAPLAICLLGALSVVGAYAGRYAVDPGQAVPRFRICIGVVLGCVVLWTVAMSPQSRPSIPSLVLWVVTTTTSVICLRWIGLRLVGSVRPHRVAVVGHGRERPADVSARLRLVREVDVVATLCLSETSTVWLPQFRRLGQEARLDRVVLDCDVQLGAIAAMQAMPRSVDISVVEGAAWIPRRGPVEQLNGLSLVHAPARPGPCSDILKRAFDIAFSASCLLLVAPFLILAALAIRWSSPGPALFRQERTGRWGQPFTLLKLRTMCEDAAEMRQHLLHLNQAEPPLFKLEPDPRSTPLGRHLRRSHLDELPQLVNVLRGEMSLVGPRPLPVDEATDLRHLAPSRHDVRPGITGPWQVSGGVDLRTEELCRLDESYVAAHFMVADLRIIGRTTARLVGHLTHAALAARLFDRMPHNRLAGAGSRAAMALAGRARSPSPSRHDNR